MSSGSTIGKRIESKRLQRVTASDVSLFGHLGDICRLSSQAQSYISHEPDREPAQSPLNSLRAPGHLALFPQGRGFKSRRAGVPPTVETSKPTPGNRLSTGGSVSAHGT